MENKVFINEEGFQEMVIVGDQTYDITLKTLEDSAKLDEQLLREKGTIKSIIDVSKMGNVEGRSLELAASNVANTSFDKLAIIGVNDLNKFFIDLVIVGAKKSDSIKVFETREEAISWLQE